MLGGEAVGRLAADKVGELVDCDARGGVPVELDVWASFALLLANSLRLSFLRTGVGLTASWTAGENGEAIAIGDSTDGVPVTPGVTTELALKGLLNSGFAGMSTWRSTDLAGSSKIGTGESRADGGAGGCIGFGEASLGASTAGASGISSTFGSGAVGAAASSASFMSTSAAGAGDDSFAGVNSFGGGTDAGSRVISIAEGSSNGGDGGSGDGLFEDTSFRAGDLPSIFIDADRIRSRCSLSSCAC